MEVLPPLAADLNHEVAVWFRGECLGVPTHRPRSTSCLGQCLAVTRPNGQPRPGLHSTVCSSLKKVIRHVEADTPPIRYGSSLRCRCAPFHSRHSFERENTRGRQTRIVGGPHPSGRAPCARGSLTMRSRLGTSRVERAASVVLSIEWSHRGCAARAIAAPSSHGLRKIGRICSMIASRARSRADGNAPSTGRGCCRRLWLACLAAGSCEVLRRRFDALPGRPDFAASIIAFLALDRTVSSPALGSCKARSAIVA